MVSRCNAKDLISPINISKENVVTECNIKCSLVTNYNPSTVNVHNKGDYLSLDYEENGSSSNNFHIKFNSIKMNISEIRVYFPSIHKYSGYGADGELLIVHQGNGSNCVVSIPIIGKKSSTTGEKTLLTIFENVKSNIPNKNESTSLNISNFNVSNILPLRVPYYYYQGQMIFAPCTQNYNYIVFDKNDYAIHIDIDLIRQMKAMFKQSNESVSKMKDLKTLSYNKHGASDVDTNGDDDIYIECKPVNLTGDVEDVQDIEESRTIGYDLDDSKRITFEDLTKNPAFDVIISFVGLFVLYTTGKYVLGYVRTRRS